MLNQIQDKLSQIYNTASQLPKDADVTSASQALGGITKQVQSMVPPVALDQTEAPTPPTFQSSPPPDDFSRVNQVAQQRVLLESNHQAEMDRINKQLEQYRQQEAQYLSKQEGVMKDAEVQSRPFREDLERTERERLKIEENFFANQAITNELDKLLTESMEMTRKLQSQRVPGLAGLQQSSRMIKAQETAQGRIAILEAVMSARNKQIGVAEGFIDRSTEAIKNDRNDRLNYLNNLYNFYEKTRSEAGTKIFNLTKDQKEVFDRQRALIEGDLQRAEATSDMVKKMMLENPKMAAESGISLTDTVEEITKKVGNWQYNQETTEIKNQAEEKGLKMLPENEVMGYPEDRVFTQIDSRGVERSFLIPPPTPEYKTQAVDGSLYRFDINTGEAELMIEGTSPAALAAYKSQLSMEQAQFKSGLNIQESIIKEGLKEATPLKIFDVKGKNLLLSKGFNAETIKQIEKSISDYGLEPSLDDAKMGDKDMSEKEKQVVRDAMGVRDEGKIINSFLDGKSDKELFTLIKEEYPQFVRKEKRGGFFGGYTEIFNTGEFKKYLENRLRGLSDKDISKKLEGLFTDEE